MQRNDLKYVLLSLCLLALLATFFTTWRGFATEQIVIDPDYYHNKAHKGYQEFTQEIFGLIEKDPRHCEKIRFFYGETLERELELKAIAVYWMRDDTQ